jgi:hypothetical protein
MRISVRVDLDNDEVQFSDLGEWLTSQQRDLLAMRAAAHAQLDEWFDAHAQRLALQVAMVERDMAGAALTALN